MPGRGDCPTSAIRVLLVALIAALVSAMIFGPIPTTAQTSQKVFRVGHLAAPGRTPDGAPPRPLREALRISPD